MNRPVVNLNSPKFDFDSKKHIANLNEHTNVIIKLQKFRTPYENIQKHKESNNSSSLFDNSNIINIPIPSKNRSSKTLIVSNNYLYKDKDKDKDKDDKNNKYISLFNKNNYKSGKGDESIDGYSRGIYIIFIILYNILRF